MRQTIVRAQRRRSGPHLIIEEVGNRLYRWIGVFAHVVITTNIHMADLAQQTGIHDVLLGLNQVGCALALGPNLHHTAVLANRGTYIQPRMVEKWSWGRCFS